MIHNTSERKRTWFPIRLDEPRPEVIVPVETERPDNGIVLTFEPALLDLKEGERAVRVFPSAARPWEILFLQMLVHRKQKWAPAHGDGIIVLEGVLPVSA